MLSDGELVADDSKVTFSLNAPSGAGCFLTWTSLSTGAIVSGLNAPSGAGCFLTTDCGTTAAQHASLNAPSGAGCFLTDVLTSSGQEFVWS